MEKNLKCGTIEFTKREKEVSNLVSKGYTDKHIAYILNISHKTIESHLRNIYSKLRTNINNENKILRIVLAKMVIEGVINCTKN